MFLAASRSRYQSFFSTMSTSQKMPPPRPLPPSIKLKKQTKVGKKDVYRVIVGRADIPKAVRVLKKIDEKLRNRKSKPLFAKMVPYHDVLVVYSSRTNFRKIITANLDRMRPCILRTPSRPGQRHTSRMAAAHPILGPL